MESTITLTKVKDSELWILKKKTDNEKSLKSLANTRTSISMTLTFEQVEELLIELRKIQEEELNREAYEQRVD